MTTDTAETDARAAYEAVGSAEYRRAGPWGNLQKLGRAYLGWDKYAERSARRELENFNKLRLTYENTSWTNEESYRDCFRRVIQSSDQHDPRRKDKFLEGETPQKYERDRNTRHAFLQATAKGATDELVSATLKLARGDKRSKSNGD